MATRRDFIKMGSLASFVGLTFGLPGKLIARSRNILFTIPPGLKTASFFTRQNFEPHLNSRFGVWRTGLKRSVSLKLVDVTDSIHRAHTPTGIRAKSCSLLFEGPKNYKLAQDTYEFRHENLGKFAAFMIPVTSETNCYEVIFNRV